MSEPIQTEKVRRDKSMSYREQADEIGERIEKEHGVSVFGDAQTTT
jgi:hypothetical protein